MADVLGGLVGVGANAATGNFLGAGISAVGLGMSIFGGMSQSAHAKEAYNIQSNITGLENQVNDQRQEAMMLSARRQQLEILRVNQRARALAQNTATSQGAQFGSGLQGGLAQVEGQGMFNLQGVNQNVEIGQNIFGINRDISKQKLALSQVQTNMATDQGISSLGGSIMKAGDPASRLLQQFTGGGPITLGGPNGPTPFS